MPSRKIIIKKRTDHRGATSMFLMASGITYSNLNDFESLRL